MVDHFNMTTYSTHIAGTPIYFDKTRVESIAALVGMFPPGSFASPFRSTVPLVDMVLRAPDRLHAIAVACGAEQSSSLHFEYRVESLVRGNPSQTDLMVLGRGRSLAIEAKWTEPRYATVRKRLLARRSSLTPDDMAEAVAANRRAQKRAVSSWLEPLARCAPVAVTVENVTDVVYQMIHRAASACLAGDSPSLLYLHFHAHDDPRAATLKQYRDDMTKLYSALGRPEGFPFFVVEQPIVPLDSFRGIEGLGKRVPGTDAAVRAALTDGPLFAFGDCMLEQIR